MTNNRSKLKITFNAPAILTFALACVVVQVLNVLTHGESNRVLFSTYRSSLINPLTWVRCVTHVLGHADWGHLLNNMMLLLVLGPMLEEKYGTKKVARTWRCWGPAASCSPWCCSHPSPAPTATPYR